MRTLLALSVALLGSTTLLGGCGGRTPLSDPLGSRDGGRLDVTLGTDRPATDGPRLDVPAPPDEISPTVDATLPPPDLGVDLPPTIETLGFRVVAIKIDQIGATRNTDLPRVFSELLTLAVSGTGAGRTVEPHDLVLALTPGPGGPRAITLTLCRAEMLAPGSYACTRPRTPTTAYYDGELVAATEPFSFFFELGVQGQRQSFRFDELLLSGGPVDRRADWTIGFQSRLGGFFCQDTLLLPPGLCASDQVDLFDLIDGPLAGCGQDGSVTDRCELSQDPVEHNPQPPEGYILVGNMALTPITLVDF